MNILTCPHCNKQFNGNTNQEGDYWICPHCKALISEGEPPRMSSDQSKLHDTPNK